jgi:hypothetical protein
MSSPLYRALVNEAIQDEWIDGLQPVPDEGTDAKLPMGDRALRGEVRLLIKAVVDDYLTVGNRQSGYRHLLRRVPWVNSRASAVRAMSRFLQIAGYADRDYGEETASSWSSAAELAGWLLADYNGWSHRETYLDLAGWYFNALRGGGGDKEVIRKLLESLKTKGV